MPIPEDSPAPIAGSLAAWVTDVPLCDDGFPTEPRRVFEEPVCGAIGRKLGELYAEIRPHRTIGHMFEPGSGGKELSPAFKDLGVRALELVRSAWLAAPDDFPGMRRDLTDRDWLTAGRLATRAFAVASPEVRADLETGAQFDAARPQMDATAWTAAARIERGIFANGRDDADDENACRECGAPEDTPCALECPNRLAELGDE